MSHQRSAYQEYMKQFEGQAEPECYGGYNQRTDEIAKARVTPTESYAKMGFNTCVGAYILPDERVAEKHISGQCMLVRFFVFASLDAYRAYVRPMSFNQYHEF